MVIEHAALHSSPCCGDQLVGQRAAEPVVVDDEKLHPNGFAGFIDGLKNRVEGCRPVDEELNMIRTRGGKAGEVFRHTGGLVEKAPECGFIAVEVPDDGLQGVLQWTGWRDWCERVTGEARLAKNQKEGNSYNR